MSDEVIFWLSPFEAPPDKIGGVLLGDRKECSISSSNA